MRSAERAFRAITPAGGSEKDPVEVRARVAEPIRETPTKIIFLGVTLEKASDASGSLVPRREQYADYYNDPEISLPMQRDIAVAFSNGDPLFIEGGTSLGKTTTVRMMASKLGYEVHYINLNSATDVEDLMGRYIPNPRRVKPDDPEYVFADGKVTSGLRREPGKKKIIFLDEYGGASPGVKRRLHEILDALERNGSVTLSEDASEVVHVSKEDTKLIAVTNPPGKGYLQLEPEDPAQLRRWVYLKFPSRLPKGAFSRATDALFGLAEENASVLASAYLPMREQPLLHEQLQEIPGMSVILNRYREFHAAAQKLVEERKIAEDQPQPFTYDDRMEPRRVRDFILRFYQGNLDATFQQALRYYYANKLESAEDRAKMEELIRLVQVTAGDAGEDARRRGLTREAPVGEGAPAAEGPAVSGAEGESALAFERRRAALAERLRGIKRASGEATVLSAEHLKALDTIFGAGNLERVEAIDPAELTDAYFDKMYPKEKRAEDEKRGLVSYRPSWWKDKADASIVGPREETWGEAYVRSMRAEAESLAGTIIFAESIQKPNYTDGSQEYGSVTGEAGRDWSKTIMKQCFGEGVNRFNHSHDELTASFGSVGERVAYIAKRQEEYTAKNWGTYSFARETLSSPLELTQRLIEKLFTDKGLPVPAFQVILEPALIFNHQTTELHPENSKTNTWERSSTILISQDGKDTGHRLRVGRAGNGGAGSVGRDDRGDRGVDGGFRLAVVLTP
ncbi:MAG: AAA family ATPase [bacterium]|nr:AAA family ATPase [bacterium]